MPVNEKPVPVDRLRQEAADWVVRLSAADGDERQRLEAECEAWQAGDERHRRLFRQMQGLWSAVQPRRRKARAVASLLSVLVLAGLLHALPWSYWQADYRTARGEVRSLVLPDGSRLVMNSGTAVDLRFDADQRTVLLRQGEVLVDVAAEAGRPFRVQSRHGEATALGTRYSLLQRPDHSLARVQASRVRVSNSRGDQIQLRAGQALSFSHRALGQVQVSSRHDDAWTQQRLVFEDVPLAEVVAELSRHRPGLLRLGSRAADRRLAFTGVLPLDDSEAALKMLAESLQLERRQFTAYAVWLDSR